MQTLHILLILGLTITCAVQDDWIDPFDITMDESLENVKMAEDKQSAQGPQSVQGQQSAQGPQSVQGQQSAQGPQSVQGQQDQTTTTAPPSASSTPAESKERDDSAENKPTKARNDVGLILFQNLVKNILNHLDGKHPESTSQEYNMLIKLTNDDLRTLQRFVGTQRASPHDVHEILKSMVQNIKKSNIGTMGKMSLWFEEKFGASIDAALKIFLLLILILIFTMLEMRLHIPWRQRLMQLVILSFFISIPMTWYELYKAAEIQQQTTAMKDAPADCVSKDGVEKNWLEAATGMLSSLMTFKEDNCQKYYEKIVIDPFIKVPPTKAIGITIVRFLISPLKDVGSAMSQFIRELLIDLPLTLYPVAIAMVSIFLFLLLFMWFGYSIRLPFFLSIEPTPYQAVTGETQNVQAIEENGKMMIEQMKVIQEDMQAQNDQILDRMNSLEKLQKAAIEFTAASACGDNQTPTLPAGAPKLMTQLSLTGKGDTLLDESVDSTPVKSPIPCSDSSLEQEEDTSPKIVESESLEENMAQSKHSPSFTRSSKLPVSMNKSKEKDNISQKVIATKPSDGCQEEMTHPKTETLTYRYQTAAKK